MPAADAAANSPASSIQGISLKPQLITRRQYAKSLAALARADAAAAAAGAGKVSVQQASNMVGVLTQHNGYRARHSAPAMSWDAAAEAGAASWASQCRWEHAQNTGYGENLYWSSSSDVNAVIAAATPGWYVLLLLLILLLFVSHT
jgi:hypothetical protein